MADTTAKLRQAALTATWRNGKDGFLAAISESALNYSADPTILPSEFGDLSSKQAVANYGGFYVAHKGFTPELVYGFANTIAKKYEELNKSLSRKGDDIIGILTDLDNALTNENESKARQALYLGETTDALAKRLDKLAGELVAANSVATTIKAQVLAGDVIAKLKQMLPSDGSGVKTTERVLIA